MALDFEHFVVRSALNGICSEEVVEVEEATVEVDELPDKRRLLAAVHER